MAAKHIVLTEKNGGMKDLMEKYYNMIYYCAYKILFYFLYRLINPFYWIGLKKWNNNYINRCILINKKLESDTSDKGIDSWISVLAITSVYSNQPLDNCRYMYYRHSVFKNKNFINNCIYI
mgnify:CR=1 FL=1